jgi:hypothetical protein
MAPTASEFATRWREMREAIMAGIEAGRLHHPKASLQEIAAAVDERLAEQHTRLWQDVALASRATDVSQARGRRERQLTTPRGKPCDSGGALRCARPVSSGFFPLDAELAWPPGQLTPQWHESLVRLGGCPVHRPLKRGPS